MGGYPWAWFLILHMVFFPFIFAYKSSMHVPADSNLRLGQVLIATAALTW